MQNILDGITKIVLNESSTDIQIETALDQFITLCSAISEIEPALTFSAWSNDTELNSGVAINPNAAAQCLKDTQRSLIFIRGVHAALMQLRQSQMDEPIEVLYAGCGPYAALLLPLLIQFPPEQLSIQLIDIHAQSLVSVEKLVMFFGFNKFNIRYYQGDACSFQADRAYNLIIAETMQKALEQEPQFKLTAHLAQFLKPEGIFVPQLISLQIWLTDWTAEKHWLLNRATQDLPARIGLCEAMQLTPFNANDYYQKQQLSAQTAVSSISLGDFVTPNHLPDSITDIVMSTRIQVFGCYKLNDYECTLTDSTKFYEVSPAKPGRRYQVSYILGGYPKFAINEQH